jgi:chemotaxis family two-component system sensor kinase Cph1
VSVKSPLDLTACEREPIHIPGSIQPHGLLLVVDQGADVIVQVAGDAQAFVSVSGLLLGRTAEEVLGVSFSDLMKRADVRLLREPTYLGTVGPFAGGKDLTITAHQFLGAGIIEAEPAVPAASAAATLADIRSITERIGAANDTLKACEIAVREVRRITGYDRVMVYHFLPDGTGSVIAEAKDDHLASFLNHRFPGSDIPRQAHELYKRNVIRVIPDVRYTPAPLVPALRPGGKPLDMSHCALRSVAPVHIQYLKNMGVGASMSVSLMPSADLWGLIACHNTFARLVPYEARETCRHVGQILSQQLRAQGEVEAHRAALKVEAAQDKAVRELAYADDPSARLLALCPTLHAIAGSHGAAVILKDDVVVTGRAPSALQIQALGNGSGFSHPSPNGRGSRQSICSTAAVAA